MNNAQGAAPMFGKQKITAFLWFDGNAEEAANHYISIFRNSKVLSILRCGEAGPGPKGSVLTISFVLDGEEFIALNGGPGFKFTEAISLAVSCDTQQEVDDLWRKLSAGGAEGQCGWLKDKFGLSWQVVPEALPRLLEDPDPSKARRAMEAMMKMTKIDIAQLERACGGR
jgi:predicted 3-demethylubiquinone-9 3-methyltransferase (glyoxalase superfamily)